MSLASVSFIIFLLLGLIAYWTFPKSAQKIILLILSLFFYVQLDPTFGWVIFWVIGVSYLVGISLQRPNNKQNSTKRNLDFVRLIMGVSVVVITLILFKYLPYWQDILSNAFPISLSGWKLSRYVIPVGLSFYSFQALSYLVDVYQKKIAAEKNLLNYSLSILFFPKLIAGPIERGTTLLAQFVEPKTWSTSRAVNGVQLFALGAFKKLVVADNLAVVVDRVFINLETYRGLSLVLAMVFFSWQLYADFSGYTDMARGTAKLFGFDLLENFNVPYLAKSIREFWRRWHISLSSWLRDYLYFPLGGSRKGFFRTLANIMIVFAICGAWHGATSMFVLWGIYHGVVLCIERVMQKIIAITKLSLFKVPQLVSTVIGVCYAFTTVTISWVLFRSANLEQASYIYKNSLVGLSNFIRPDYIQASLEWLFKFNYLEMAIALGGLASIIIIDLLAYNNQLRKFRQLPVVVKIGVYIVLVSSIVILRRVETTQFIYVIF